MPSRFRCHNGHPWTQDAAPPAACPTCGAAFAETMPPRDDRLPTVAQSSGPPLVGYLFGQDEIPQLPDFEIIGKLGRGGMGVVYKARRRADERIVAVKVIRSDRLQHEEAVRRFRREAQALARLAHPNIVQVLDADQSGDLHYLVMEYLEGVNLDQLVAKQGAQPFARAADFMRQAALGLQHAFERGLVHRDIKPSNLMVSPAPPPAGQEPKGRYQYVVKVLDLSVARLLNWPGQADSLSTLTQGGAVIGTADFVAPSSLRTRAAPISARDLYSLGCTFTIC
ncbi:MAG: serine/threonine-protein kinase [Gemmataceae bacterium]